MSQGNRTFAIVFVLAAAILVGWAGWFELQNWTAARDRGIAFAEAKAQLLAEQTIRAVEVADVALVSVKSVMEQYGPDHYESDIYQAELLQQIRGISDPLEAIQSLGWIDTKGDIRVSSALGIPDVPLVVADRDYFQHFAAHPHDSDRYLSELTQGRRNGRWFIGLARAVYARDGAFNGLVLAPLEPRWFLDTFREANARDGLSVVLVTKGGKVISAVFDPKMEQNSQNGTVQTGTPLHSLEGMDSLPWQRVFAPDQGQSLATMALTPDGGPQGLVAVQRVGDLPLAVMVMVPWDQIVSNFQQDLVRDMGLLAVVLLVLVGLWGPVSRAMRDRDRLFDLSPDPVCVTDNNGTLLRANGAWEHALGYRAEEILGTNHLDLIHPLDREDARRLHARLLAGEAVQDVPLRYKGQGGQSVWLSWSAIGEGSRVFAIARDITRRRDTERALAKSEARFRDVAEALGEFIWEVDAQGKMTFLSERARSTLAGAPKAFLGLPLSALLDNNSAERFCKAISRGTPFVMEVVAYRGVDPERLRTSPNAQVRVDEDGDAAPLIWLRLSGVPVLSTVDGSVVGFRGAGVDVTESKTSRQALADSEARYRSIVNTVVDGIITIDERGTMQSINPAAEAIFGYSARELVGRNVNMLMPSPYADGHDDFLMSYMQTGERKIIGCGGREVIGCRRDGSTFPLELGVSEVYFGAQRFFIGMCRDVSERKRIERLKDEFVSTVSHELRTPLTSIRGSLGLIAGGAAGELPSKAKRLVEIAHSNCQRLVNLVNDILDIQKIEAGGMAFDIESIDFLNVVRRSVDENGSYAQQFGVSVSMETDLTSVMVRGDFNRLLQVVTNLLSNAVKFSPKDETVVLRVFLRDRTVVLEVSDHGPGISEEFRPRIFQKFSQADATDTRAKGGTGLGLSISRAITERHGGELTFESEPGNGATFIMAMPALIEDQASSLEVNSALKVLPALGQPEGWEVDEPEDRQGDHDPSPEASAHGGEGDTDTAPSNDPSSHLGGPPQILVIEDDPDVGHLMKLLLSADGYRVDLADTAQAARSMLEQNRYDAITMDVLLPDADGLSLANELRARPNLADIPVIVVSAVAQENARRLEGASLRISDWIGKPIDESRLREALRKSTLPVHDVHQRPKILHVEDDHDLRATISFALDGIADILGAETLAEARSCLQSRDWDLVLLDMTLPDGNGRDLLADIARCSPSPKVVVFSGSSPTREDAQFVASVLEKSKTCSEDLIQTIQAVVRQQRKRPS